MYIFEISTKRQIFLCPFWPIQRKKISSLRRVEGTMNLFEELKRSKMEETAQYFEKRFFMNTDLRFLLPFQNFMPNNEIMKICKNH
jgi:hypothetical protein